MVYVKRILYTCNGITLYLTAPWDKVWSKPPACRFKKKVKSQLFFKNVYNIGAIVRHLAELPRLSSLSYEYAEVVYGASYYKVAYKRGGGKSRPPRHFSLSSARSRRADDLSRRLPEPTEGPVHVGAGDRIVSDAQATVDAVAVALREREHPFDGLVRFTKVFKEVLLNDPGKDRTEVEHSQEAHGDSLYRTRMAPLERMAPVFVSLRTRSYRVLRPAHSDVSVTLEDGKRLFRRSRRQADKRRVDAGFDALCAVSSYLRDQGYVGVATFTVDDPTLYLILERVLEPTTNTSFNALKSLRRSQSKYQVRYTISNGT